MCTKYQLIVYNTLERAFKIIERKRKMKKLSLLFLSMLLVGCTSNAAVQATATPEASTAPVAATVDTFTSASKDKYYYKDSALTDDALWNVMATYQAAPTIATVNPDGTPNLAVFMPGMPMELNGERYFVFGLADNQTKLNLEANKVGVLSLYQQCCSWC